MLETDYTNKLLRFIKGAPTPFHAVAHIEEILLEKGFTKLFETSLWGPLEAGSYYVIRNDSSLIAFILKEDLAVTGMRLMGAHTDSPCLKVKPNPLKTSNSVTQICAEVYGGALLNPWFDRDLSLAGRLTWHDKGGTQHSRLIDFTKAIAIIPSLAIHLDREANKEKSINAQTDLVPVVMQSLKDQDVHFQDILKKQLQLEYPELQVNETLDYELFFYDTQAPAKIGLHGEFLSGARLDNLLSCFTLTQALINTEANCSSLMVLNDHEEVGSVSTSGAQGPFLASVLERLVPDIEKRQMCIAKSLFISADNAHAVHPNFPDKHDKNHLPLMNHGPTIKINANQRYATSSITAAFFRMLCERANVPVQDFVMRNDMACGSTIGPITAGETGIKVVDVGVPSLAMHSIRETVGSLDGWYLFRTLKEYINLTAQSDEWKGEHDYLPINHIQALGNACSASARGYGPVRPQV